MNKYLFALFLSHFIASLAQILLKKSALKRHKSFIEEYFNFNVIFGYALMVLSMLCTVYSYKGLEYKYVSIIGSLGYVVLLIMCKAFFNEEITKNKIIGTIIILIGILIFSL